MAKSIFQVEDDKHLQAIAAKEAKIRALAALSDAEVLDQLQAFELPINRIPNQATVYEKAVEEKRYGKILNWLSHTPYKPSHQRYSEFRIEGTGEWLLKQHRDYLDWKSSSASEIFLLYGAAGSGKSSLASAVVDSFAHEQAAQTSPASLAYFYCTKSASDARGSDPVKVLRSVMRQLAVVDPKRATLHSIVVSEYDRREAEAKVDGFDVKRLGKEDAVNIILNIASSDPATTVLNAINEIQSDARHELIDALKKIVKKAGNVVKIFATSRYDDQILALLPDILKVRVHTDNHQDMARFVDRSVSVAVTSCRLLGGEVKSDLQAELVKALLESSGEM